MHAGFTERLDITYATVDGRELKLDLYLPRRAPRAVPLIMYVHGGDHLDWRRSPTDIPWQSSEVKELEDAFFYRALKGHERSPMK